MLKKLFDKLEKSEFGNNTKCIHRLISVSNMHNKVLVWQHCRNYVIINCSQMLV